MYFSDVKDLICFIESQKRYSPKVGLEKMHFLCQLFGHPEKNFNSIHVTGTNGKGSVVSYLASILKEANLKVATFTSPYIVCFNERISYNAQMINDADLLRISNFILSKYDLIQIAGYELPSFFEFVTLIAFLYFSEKKDLDFAIIEVGIGGLLDSTNVITPLISIISNVAYDHMNVLGSTLASILNNKLGIVKAGVPLITGIKDQVLINQVNVYCEKLDAPLYLINQEEVTIHEMNVFGTLFSTPSLQNVKINLAGFHQIDNSLIAIQAIKVLNSSYFRNKKSSNFMIDDVILKRGLSMTKWPGRFEVINQEPLVIIDGGHNVDGITRIVEFVKTLPHVTKRCIFACSDDKEKEEMIKLLDPTFDEIIFTAFTYKRHSDATALFNYSRHQHKILDFDLNHIIQMVWDNPADLNLFIGSLYFVSEIRPLLIKKSKSN